MICRAAAATDGEALRASGVRRGPNHSKGACAMTRLATTVRNHGPWVSACLAVLALAGGLSAVALASETAYSVKVKVVKPTVPRLASFKVVATGVSANTSQLVVYLNPDHTCARTAAGETTLPKAVEIINKHVVGAYAATRAEVAHFLGRHYACAYLRSIPPPTPVLLRARASALYTVIRATG
jgi:hypothetical protein